jgi:hypothetical protein
MTMVTALMLVLSLGLLVHTQDGRSEHPARLELSNRLAVSLDQLAERTEALAQSVELAGARQARQELALAVLAFDQALVALAETSPDHSVTDAVTGIQIVWRELGLDLADLAAGEYAANSPAGRETVAQLKREVAPLREHLQAVTAALYAVDQRSGRKTALTRSAAVILAGATLLLGLAAFRPRRERAAGAQSSGVPGPSTVAISTATAGAFAATAAAASGGSPSAYPNGAPGAVVLAAAPGAAPGDLGLASAAVDRVSVDMLTIARSAERMQQAVDSVTTALQGMLYSLNDLAQDAHEGSRITRTANNAAVYAADTARELLDTAREMGTVVARVRGLAARSQEIAGRIEAEAAATGATGEAFTSVVAQEVKQLAAATTDSAGHIEAAVGGILASQRQYEEAIGQIIKNIGGVRKVAAHLGELMLEPPSRVQPGAAYAPPPVMQPLPPPPPPPSPATPAPAVAAESPAASAPESADPSPAQPVAEAAASTPTQFAAPEVSAPTSEPIPEPVPDPAADSVDIEELSAVTDNLLDELAQVAAETNQKTLGASEPDPAAAAPTAKPPAPASVPAAKARKAPPTPSGSNSNVFMLKRPKPASEAPATPDPAPEPVAEPTAASTADPTPESPSPASPPPAPAPAAPAPPPAPAAPAAAPAAATPEPPVESLTDEEAEEALATTEPETADTAAGAAKPRPVAQGASGNIFMLNKPKK